MNEECYRLEQIDYSDGLFNLDVTYIIHLEGNGRLEHIKSQLNEYHPTNLVYILHNKGFKKCNKKIHLNEPKIDLIDAFIYIFKDAKSKNYQNIIILEDDFTFNEKIKNPKIIQNITEFIYKKTQFDESFIYMLGCLPFLQRQYDDYTNLLLCGIGTHACIYSRKCIENILNLEQKNIDYWDYYTFLNFTKFMYHEPLCYQLFPETENQKNWYEFYGVKYLFILLLKLCKLDIQPEPGYTLFYNISKFLYIFFIIFLIFITLFLISIIYNYVKQCSKKR